MIKLENESKFVERLIYLRHQRGVSARDMSLSLGQSDSYINKIENRKSLPSLTGFFYICEYFNITPKEFFDYDLKCPNQTNELLNQINKLDYSQTSHVLAIVNDINKK